MLVLTALVLDSSFMMSHSDRVTVVTVVPVVPVVTVVTVVP